MAPLSNQLTILQWNVCGLQSRLAELKNYIFEAENSPDVICVQETFLKENKSIDINNYNIERRDRMNAEKGGVATFINKNLTYTRIPGLNNIEELTINLDLAGQHLTISNIYNPPGHEIDRNAYNVLASKPNLIITGDFNAHHPMFGGQKTDSAGKTMESLIDDNNLCLLNDKSGTYLTNKGSTTAIDLTITSRNLATKCNWTVFNNTMGSDHYPITTSINDIEIPNPIAEPSYIYKRANWQHFKDESNKTFNDNIHSTDINQYHSNILTAIHQAAENSIPLTRPNRRKNKAVPYWNEKCQDSINKRNKAQKKMKRTRDLDDRLHPIQKIKS
jgi:exonuclease III